MKYFIENGSRYRIRVARDDDPWNPRTDCDGNIGNMMIWWNRYSLGDENRYLDAGPEEYQIALVKEKVPESAILELVKGGNASLRVEFKKDEGRWYLYERKRDSYISYDNVLEGYMIDDMIEYLTFAERWELLKKHADIVYLPLYAYEHGMITISASSGYPYNDRWDGGQCGWIWTDKETVMKHCGGYRDDSDEFHPLTEENWEEVASYAMLSEVKTYDQYLQGDVYGYIVEKYDPEINAWEDNDSCWGFYSDKFGEELEEELAREFTSAELLDEMPLAG